MDAAALSTDGRRRKVVVTGCLAQRYGQQLAADLAEADLVVGFEAYGGLAATLGDSLGVQIQQQQQGGGTTPSSSTGAGGEGAGGGHRHASSSSQGMAQRVQVRPYGGI